MTSTTIDQVCVPATGRDARVLTSVRDRAIDGLAGRTVWCVAALSSRRPAARETNAHLEWARDGGVATDAPAITTARGAWPLAERLDGLLRGRAAAELGPWTAGPSPRWWKTATGGFAAMSPLTTSSSCTML